MFEIVKEVDNETIIKKQITYLSWDNTISLQADNVEDLYDINYLRTIESGVTKIMQKWDN